MAKSRKRADETGSSHKGRHEFHRHEMEVIRAYLRLLLGQVTRSEERMRSAIPDDATGLFAGQLKYWESISSYLRQRLSSFRGACDDIEWHDAWTHVTTVERHSGTDAGRNATPTIPGME